MFLVIVTQYLCTVIIQVVVSKVQTKPRYFHLSRSLGKYIGRGKRQSIAKAVLENEALRREVITQIGLLLQREIKMICSDTHDSILRMKSKIALEKFTWERVWLELEENTPLLVSIFLQMVPRCKREDESTKATLCLCMCIFC